jgi:uncharacterized alpha/beta hydrolase family protein
MELGQLEEVRVLSGSILDQTQPDKNVLILLFETTVHGPENVQATILKPGMGRFAIETHAGSFFMLAFEDLNNNMTYDRNEPAGFFGKPDEIIVSKTSPHTLTGLDIVLKAGNTFVDSYLTGITFSPQNLSRSFIKIGQIIEFGDPILSQGYGIMGYWEPLTFVREVGFCIFFTEKYDPGKIPVLFIHGAAGTPAAWEKLVGDMDRKRFQPWLYYYPSGLPLDNISTALYQMMMALRSDYGFKKVHIVSHSMGGLVARSFIFKNREGGHLPLVDAFVSISTPWNGHRMAATGVKGAPAAIPSWYDMVPDSEFIRGLFQERMPPLIKYYLVFSYQGDCRLLLSNNDGTVEISSQLDIRAQEDATRISGFDESHTSILTSETAIEHIIELFTEKK